MRHFLLNSMRSLASWPTLLVALAVTARAAVLPVASPLAPLDSGFGAPARIASDSQSRLYVSYPQAGVVVVWDAFGRIASVAEGLGQPLGIAVDVDARIYVGDAQRGAVNIYDAQWNLLGQLGGGAGEFQLPGYVLTTASSGVTTVFVSDALAHAVKAYRNGALIGTYGSYGIGPNQFEFPAGLWAGPDGSLFVVDQNNNRVQVLDANGNFLRWFTLDPSVFSWGASGRGQGLAGDSQGRLYVSDTYQDYVKTFDQAGTFLGYAGAYGEDFGQLRSPAGLGLDGQGRLWVADINNARLSGFGLDCFTQLAVSPAAQSFPTGATVTFSANSGCGGATGFQWFKDGSPLTDGGIISGATNATLVLTGITAAEAGSYSVTVTGPGGTVSSPPAPLAVISAPLIVSSPTSITAAQGGTATFNASAIGSGLTYRWFCNGFELLGSNGKALVLTNVQPPAAGKYWLVVTNAAGAATSAQASLNVLALPFILVAPTDQTALEHGTASFGALGSGSPPLRYQWYRGSAALTGQTASTLILSNVSPAVNDSYFVRVSNGAGATNSSSAKLTVTPDTVRPTVLYAAGGAATSSTILVSFSEAVSLASAQQPLRYQLIGPGNLSVVSASVIAANNAKVLLRLSDNRSAAGDYFLIIRDVTDTAFVPNTISPNPTTVSVMASDSISTVAWWPLSEGSGTTTREAAGTGLDGTLESATWTTGRSGWGVNLDGTSGDVSIPPLYLYTNTVTISAWIRRSGSQASSAGLVFCRDGSTVAGLRFGSTNELRYNWNNASAAYNFSSGLVPPDGQWAFVALALEPSRAILYLNSGSGLRSATNITTHAIEEFNGITYFGWDSNSSSRRFKGVLDDVRICNRALTAGELQALYSAVASPATCSMASPANGQIVYSANPALVANVVSNGNTINKVEFLSGTTILGVARTTPYTFTWTNLAAGTYTVKARAYFGPASYTADSAAINFTVKIPLVASLSPSGTGLLLTWSGGSGPYQVQTTTNLANPAWANIGAPTTNTSQVVTPGNQAAFFRVVGN